MLTDSLCVLISSGLQLSGVNSHSYKDTLSGLGRELVWNLDETGQMVFEKVKCAMCIVHILMHIYA